MFCLLCRRLISRKCMNLFLGWALYSVPLVYVSVFVLVPYCLEDCSFVVSTEVRELDYVFFLKIFLLSEVFNVSIQGIII